MFRMVTAELWMALLGVSLVVVIFVFVLRSVAPVMPFFYSNAVIQARASALLKGSQWKDLAENKSLSELANNLKGSDYGDDSLGKATNISEFHAAVEQTFIKRAIEIEKLSPKKMLPVFSAYNMFWEAKMLKTFYRSRFNMHDAEVPDDLEKKGLVFAVGNITDNILRHLSETKTVKDIRVVMLQTEYANVFEEEHSSIQEFEVALDNFVLRRFLETAEKIRMHDAKAISEIMKTKFDILNILALLKAETRGIPKDEREKILIKTGSEVSKLIPKLVNAKDISDFVDLCSKLRFYDALKEGLDAFKKDGSLAQFEKELYAYYKGFITGEELKHTLGPYPIFAYLTKKEVEMRNILAISKGIDSGFAPKEIMEMVL